MFLDRDGTINVKADDGAYVSSPVDMVLLPGAAGAVRRLNELGVLTVLVTNQRWMSFPGADPEGFAATQARLEELLGAEGAHVDAVYHCPHAHGSCGCRKPAPGMLRAAARDLQLDLRASVVIGDAVSDVRAGRAAGAGTILLGSERDAHPLADAVASNLASAVDLVLPSFGYRARGIAVSTPGSGPHSDDRCHVAAGDGHCRTAGTRNGEPDGDEY